MSVTPTDPTPAPTPAPTSDPRAVLGVQINEIDLITGIATATVVLEDGTVQTAQWPVTLVSVTRTAPIEAPPGQDTASTP